MLPGQWKQWNQWKLWKQWASKCFQNSENSVNISVVSIILSWQSDSESAVSGTFEPRLRVTSNAEELWPKANWQSFDFGRLKQLFHTSQTGPPFRAFYWVTTFSSARRVSGWPRKRNIGGVTGELRRLGLSSLLPDCRWRKYSSNLLESTLSHEVSKRGLIEGLTEGDGWRGWV